MYYEDLGIYFHDNSYYSVENPVVRDELWQYRRCDNYEDEYDGEELRRFIRIEFDVSELTADEKADLEYELTTSFPSGDLITYLDENHNDNGDREISGSANSAVYYEVLDILKAYGITDISDFTEYA